MTSQYFGTFVAGAFLCAGVLGIAACSSDSDPSNTGGTGGSAGAAGGAGTGGSAGAAGGAGTGGSAGSAGFAILDPTQEHYGKTYGAWSGAWWKWIYELPGPDFPVVDTTGAHCALGQSGDVFFLAGTTSSETVTRTCTIPAGKALFFPLANLAGDNGGVPQAEWSTDQELKDWVTETLTTVTELSVEIDGEAVGTTVADFAAYKTGPDQFSYTVPDTADNYYRKLWETDFSGLVDPSFAGGYHLMLAPLSAGSHVIHLHTKIMVDPQSPFEFDVTYNLTVQ